MGIDNIWVFAQAAEGAPTSGTLELLTKARSLAGNVSAFSKRVPTRPPTPKPTREPRT